MLLVYRYRIKSLTGLLHSQARACNFVWNFCNETQLQALKWNKRWPSGFDLNRLTAGSSKDLALHAGTINAVCEQSTRLKISSSVRDIERLLRESTPFRARRMSIRNSYFAGAGADPSPAL